MGTSCSSAAHEDNHRRRGRMIERLKLKGDFDFIRIIGRGGFGCVWKVVDKRTREIFALKIMDKAKIIIRKSIKSVANQRLILQQLLGVDCRLIVKMQAAFQDRENLYLLLNYIEAGDLRHYINLNVSFNEHQIKFIIRCLLHSLQALHRSNIIHRDLKPENIIIDKQGYAHLIDLGIARHWKPNNNNQTSGTPSYMAPEVLRCENYSFTADYYAIGVIAYELAVRKRPLSGKDRLSITEELLLRQPKMPNKYDNPLSEQGQNFINGLLSRKKTSRLGANGIEQILQHPWLSLSLQEEYKFRYQFSKSPISPLQESRFKGGQQETDFKEDQKYHQTRLLLQKKEIQSFFNHFQFVPPQHQQPEKHLLFL